MSTVEQTPAPSMNDGAKSTDTCSGTSAPHIHQEPTAVGASEYGAFDAFDGNSDARPT
jgi:hypothetical protein